MARSNTQLATPPVPNEEYEQAANRRGDHPANEVIAHDQPIYSAAGVPSRAFGSGGVRCSARIGDRTRAFGICVRTAIPAQYTECVHDAARRFEYALSAHPERWRKREHVSKVILVGRRIFGSRKARCSRVEPSPFHAPKTGATNIDRSGR